MRHIAALSGGDDSSVMWLLLNGYFPGYTVKGIEGVFTDPGKEDRRTYARLDYLDEMTGNPIKRISGPSWDEALEFNKYFLPYWHGRWCTPTFKILPFLEYVGNDRAISYIGLRADEPLRVGYLGDKGDNVTPRYPLREMGMTESNIDWHVKRANLPPAADWSCSCCPLRPVMMWARTCEEMPEVAEWCAQVEERKQAMGGGAFTWVRGYTMRELINNPVTRAEIKARYWARNPAQTQGRFDWALNFEEEPCLMCQVK